MSEKNIEWYGKLPKSWLTPKMSYICNTITDYTASGSFASLAENVIYRDTEDYAMLVRTADLSRKRDINPVFIDEKAYNFLSNSNLFGGELIMSNVGSVGDVYLYEPLYKKASLAPNAIMVRANGYEKFLFYLFSTKQAVEGLLSITNTTTQPKFNKTQLRSFRVPFPDQLIMEKIVKHLDKKIKQIEDVENTINKEIEYLENYKKSLITEAVTKGLDKDVEMKDSGIEWIGQIPKDWKTIKLKLGLSEKMKYGANEQGVEFSDELPRYVRITDITENNRLKEHEKLSLSEEKSVGYILKDKTVLFARSGATVGKTFFYKSSHGRAAFAGYLISAKTNNRILLEKWLYYFTMTHSYDQWINQIYSQSTIQNISAEKYSNMELPITNIENQKNIIIYLNKKTKLIDETISIKQKQLETLEEYKKSLIYEYVTGKKEV